MGNLLKYATAAASGFVGSYLGRYIGPDWGALAGGAVASAISIIAGRYLHLTPAPTPPSVN